MRRFLRRQHKSYLNIICELITLNIGTLPAPGLYPAPNYFKKFSLKTVWYTLLNIKESFNFLIFPKKSLFSLDNPRVMCRYLGYHKTERFLQKYYFIECTLNHTKTYIILNIRSYVSNNVIWETKHFILNVI